MGVPDEPGTFMEISVGGLGKGDLLQRLVAAGIQFNKYAHLLFAHQSFSPDHPIERAKLVKVKPSDLGLGGPFSYPDILSRASRLGLKPCPLYLGAFLRLEYLDQTEGPYLTVASAQLGEDESFPTGFYLRNIDGSLWLRGYRVQGDAEWPPENEFVFLSSG